MDKKIAPNSLLMLNFLPIATHKAGYNRLMLAQFVDTRKYFVSMNSVECSVFDSLEDAKGLYKQLVRGFQHRDRSSKRRLLEVSRDLDAPVEDSFALYYNKHKIYTSTFKSFMDGLREDIIRILED